jgi:chaperonin GroES
MKVKPLHDRVLVRRFDPEEKVKAREKPLEGKVVSAGPGKLDDKGKLIPMQVKAGDRVLIGKYAGTEVKIADVEHVIVREDEILGVIG